MFSPNQRATCYVFQISVTNSKRQKNLILLFSQNLCFSKNMEYQRKFSHSSTLNCDVLQLCEYNFPIKIFANEASKRSSTWLVISWRRRKYSQKQRRRNRQRKKRRWTSRGHSRLCKPRGSTRYLAACRLSNNIIAQRQREP